MSCGSSNDAACTTPRRLSPSTSALPCSRSGSNVIGCPPSSSPPPSPGYPKAQVGGDRAVPGSSGSRSRRRFEAVFGVSPSARTALNTTSTGSWGVERNDGSGPAPPPDDVRRALLQGTAGEAASAHNTPTRSGFYREVSVASSQRLSSGGCSPAPDLLAVPTPTNSSIHGSARCDEKAAVAVVPVLMMALEGPHRGDQALAEFQSRVAPRNRYAAAPADAPSATTPRNIQRVPGVRVGPRSS